MSEGAQYNLPSGAGCTITDPPYGHLTDQNGKWIDNDDAFLDKYAPPPPPPLPRPAHAASKSAVWPARAASARLQLR
jgi:hypothetical protein